MDCLPEPYVPISSGLSLCELKLIPILIYAHSYIHCVEVKASCFAPTPIVILLDARWTRPRSERRSISTTISLVLF